MALHRYNAINERWPAIYDQPVVESEQTISSMTEDLVAKLQNPLVRIGGRDAPAGHVLAAAVAVHKAPLTLPSTPGEDDYALLDPALDVIQSHEPLREVIPPGIGYAGMTPRQRGLFLAWLDHPDQPAPVAFQELYVAQLEVRLLEFGHHAGEVEEALVALQLEPAWQAAESVSQAMLLGLWLKQEGGPLRDWLVAAPLTPRLLSRGIGLQALLDTPLSSAQLAKMGQLWQLPGLSSRENILKTRLASMAEAVGGDPLTYALEGVGDEAISPSAWRAAHRTLRFALPQPNLRPLLEALIAEVVTVATPVELELEEEADGQGDLDALVDFDAAETIILEFGESRSEYFDYVRQLAQRVDGFTQLMDEDRRLIYRVRFQKGRLRTFWRIWEYVQNWSSTRVYVDGEEIEQWKIWPYSQFLR